MGGRAAAVRGAGFEVKGAVHGATASKLAMRGPSEWRAETEIPTPLVVGVDADAAVDPSLAHVGHLAPGDDDED